MNLRHWATTLEKPTRRQTCSSQPLGKREIDSQWGSYLILWPLGAVTCEHILIEEKGFWILALLVKNILFVGFYGMWHSWNIFRVLRAFSGFCPWFVLCSCYWFIFLKKGHFKELLFQRLCWVICVGCMLMKQGSSRLLGSVHSVCFSV